MTPKNKHLAGLKRMAAVFLLLTGFITLTATAQTINREQVIELPAKSLTRQNTIAAIERQTGNKVIFVLGDLDETATVNYGGTTMVLNALLDRMLEGTGITYEVDGNYIILHRDPTASESNVVLAANRTISGVIMDNGVPKEGIMVSLLDNTGKKTVTSANGRFSIAGVTSGNHILKLTAQDGAMSRYREVNVAVGTDTDYVLSLADNILDVDREPEQVVFVPSAAKTTSYFVPNHTDNTIHALSGEAKTEYSLVPSSRTNENYLPKTAIKTNLLYLAATTPNIALEFGLAPKWTLDASVAFNPFKLSNDGINRLWFVQPELRYWFCQRFEKHFVGLHGIYGEYNVGQVDFLTTSFKEHRYDGWGVGAGISYGYHLPLGKRWGMEFTIGAGYIYFEYDKYRCYECDEFLSKKNRHYFGPTKAGISLIYSIK